MSDPAAGTHAAAEEQGGALSVDTHTRRSTNVSVRFSPVLLAVALTPIALETSTPLGCELGDTALVEFELIVRGENRIVGFDRSQRSYSVSLPWGTDEVRVRALSTDPEARLWVRLLIDGELVGDLGSPFVEGANVGGADLVVPLPPGSSTLEVWVTPPPGGVTDHYDVAVQIGGGIDPGGLVYESCSAEQTGGAGLPLPAAPPRRHDPGDRRQLRKRERLYARARNE